MMMKAIKRNSLDLLNQQNKFKKEVLHDCCKTSFLLINQNCFHKIKNSS